MLARCIFVAAHWFDRSHDNAPFYPLVGVVVPGPRLNLPN
jgi:hypothetical protein